MQRTKRDSRSAFTLIEIMLVVVIIGILMTVVVVKLGGQQEVARINAAKADIRNYSTALSLFELDNGFYPTTEQGLNALVTKPTIPPEPSNWKEYLDSPVRPDPWGTPYAYKCPGDHKQRGFDLSSAGPNKVFGDEDDITNWN
jgi:general secretion pathway protein G